MTAKPQGGPDRPIDERHDDVLDRWQLAKTIFDLIKSTPDTTTLRIGIYGGWGEGKTSVMQLVASQAAATKIPVCRFPVWSADTQADLWGGFVEALAGILPTRDRWTWFKSRGRWLAKKLSIASGAHPYASTADILTRLAGSSLRANKGDASRVIERLGAGGRVLIIVDDLDRVEPTLIPGLLMGLHELFDDLGQCAFIVAVDPLVVSRGLAKINPGWDTSSSFLNKIIQYPFWLPPIRNEHKSRLLENGVKDYALQHVEAALQDLGELLPPNPRELKQFLRGLQRFTPTLNRHGGDEWSPPLLMLCELFRYEFPEAASSLFRDPSFIREFGSGHWPVSGERYQQTNISVAQFTRIEQAVTAARGVENKAATDALVQSLAKTAGVASGLGFSSEDDVRRHMSFDHDPPVMTLLEFDLSVSAQLEDRSAKTLENILSLHSQAVGRSREIVLGSMYRALLRRRAERIDQMMVAFDSRSVEDAKAKFYELSSLLDRLIDEHAVLRDPRVLDRQELFRLLRNQHTYLVNALSETEYEELRTVDRDRAYRAACHLADLAPAVMAEVTPSDGHSIPREIAGGEEIREFKQQMLTQFAEWSCGSMLERFVRPGGIAALTKALNLHAEYWLLFTPESPFHSAEWRSKLWIATRQAGEIGAQNMFMFLRLLVGEFRSGGQFPLLARDRDLVVPAWEIASAVRPQPKMRFEVEKIARALGEAIGDPAACPLPTWPDLADSGEEAGRGDAE